MFAKCLENLEFLSNGWSLSSVSWHPEDGSNIVARMGRDNELKAELTEDGIDTLINVIKGNTGDLYKSFLLSYNFQ